MIRTEGRGAAWRVDVVAGAHWSLTVPFTRDTVDMEWDDITVTATVWEQSTGAVAKVIDVDDGTAGQLTFTLSADDTADLGAGRFGWSVELVEGGDRWPAIAGDFTLHDRWVPAVGASRLAGVEVSPSGATSPFALGLPFNIAMGDVVTLDPGEEATAALRVVGTTRFLDLGIPAGFDGDVTSAALAAAVGAHEADTSGVHGISDTAALVVRTHRLFDRGEALRAKLESRTPCSLTVFGDSTGNGADEWVHLFGTTEMAARWPNLNVDYTLWSDGSQSYPAVSQIRAGAYSATTGIFSDTFTRTVADLYDTAPDTGARWGRDNDVAAGDWSTNGTEAVRSSDATSGTMLADTGHPGDLTVTIPMNISAAASGSTKVFTGTIKRLDGNNRLIATITISGSGSASMTIAKVIAGTTTTVGSVTGVLLGGVSNQSATLVMQLSGTTFSASVTTGALGTKTASGSLTTGDLGVLAEATVIGVAASNGIDVRLASVTVDSLSTGARNALTIRNCSVAGSTIAYQQSRLATVLATAPDLLVISTGHNDGSTTAAAFLAALDTLINSVRAQAPTTGIAVSSQNPQTLGASGRLAHAARQQALRSVCRTRGVGYVPVWETWVSQARRGVDLVGADNTHPVAAGSALWADTFADYLQAAV